MPTHIFCGATRRKWLPVLFHIFIINVTNVHGGFPLELSIAAKSMSFFEGTLTRIGPIVYVKSYSLSSDGFHLRLAVEAAILCLHLSYCFGDLELIKQA